MALKKFKKGGSGGKKGHSNMEHWTGTETVKEGFTDLNGIVRTFLESFE